MSETKKSPHELIDINRLQTKQNELAVEINLALVISDLEGQLVTKPSYPPDYTSKLSNAAIKGFAYCLAGELSLSKEDLLQHRKIFTTYYSGKITTAAIPLFYNNTVYGIVHIGRMWGAVSSQLEKLQRV